MSEIYVHENHVSYVEETEFGTVICLSTGEDVYVTQTVTEVVSAFDNITCETSFCLFNRVIDDDDLDFVEEGPSLISP